MVIPDGYVEWKAKPGSVWYSTENAADKIANGFMAMLSETLDAIESKPKKEIQDELRLFIKQAFDESKHFAGAEFRMVIPEGIAKTLDGHYFYDIDKEGIIGTASAKAMGLWKQYILTNPLRFMKYNMNNTSGDLDIVIASHPAILGQVKGTIRDLNRNLKGRESEEMRWAAKYGVVDSGFAPNEVADVDIAPLLRELTGARDINVVRKYFHGAREVTRYRENILRLAAFKYFLKHPEKMGASISNELRQLNDPIQIAAKKARELLGDYGNLTELGTYMRKHTHPFWSWMEINAPRYWRLLKNSMNEGSGIKTGARMGAIGATRAGLMVGKRFIQMGLFMGVVSAWNQIVFPDEEAQMTDKERRQLHLLLFKRPNGEMVSIRIQGAYSDALDWVGMEDAWWKIQDLMAGKKDIKTIAEEMAKSPVNKLAQGIRPDIKTGAEIATGKRLYPDIFEPRQIRDRTEHALKSVSLDIPYRHVAGKPTRGWEEAENALFYSTDPGESAYFDLVEKKFDWLRKMGKEYTGGETTEKQDALYYYKKARMYGDKEAEKKYLSEYLNLGGTGKSMKESVERASPFGGLTQKNKKQFISQLSKRDYERAVQAMKWYKKLFPANN